MLFSVTLYGNRALVSHAIKRRHLYPRRNKNIIRRPPTGTLPCKQTSNSSGMLQSCSKCVQVSLLQNSSPPSCDSLTQQLEPDDGTSLSYGGKTDIARASAKKQVSSFEPALRGQGRDGALSTTSATSVLSTGM